MYLVLWEVDETFIPSDPDEREKLIMSHIEMTKKDIESGEIMMWGISVGGGCGFSVTKDNPKNSFARSMRHSPSVRAEVRPMLTLDEMMDVMKSMQK